MIDCRPLDETNSFGYVISFFFFGGAEGNFPVLKLGC
jgi:hypothetical protein